ncbi:MAG: phosphotransferase, partial [Betaproteobacteria bacterium]|nr:phosphotransferase [Betaproteobacteria bacterium]
MDRSAHMRQWLETTLGRASFRLAAASNDASFRRYFRIHFDDGRPSLIVMDAPPENEDCRPFVHVAALFAAAGVHVPALRAQNVEAGFLLLSDLGDTTYLKVLDDSSADRLYRDALDSLVRIQLASRPAELPEYARELLLRELMLFPDWYCARQLGHE